MTPSTSLLQNIPWLGLAVWVALYVSDYSLTLACARLYRHGVDKTIVFDGSFEITPLFQPDVDALRVVSPRFVRALVRSLILLLCVFWIAGQLQQPALYLFVLGSMICSELAVHVRHLRNLCLFRAMLQTDSVKGRIEYPRAIVLRMSAVELFGFAGLFLLLFGFTQNWFVLGGAFACFVTAFKHQKLARQCVSPLPYKTTLMQAIPKTDQV